MKEKHPIVFIIFGATGDLAKKKLLPALMNLYCRNFLPENFRVVGFSRKDLSDENYREFVSNSIDEQKDEHPQKDIDEFLSKIHYKQGDINNIDDYESLSKYLNDVDEKMDDCSNKLFHLAVPPRLYETIFQNLANSGLSTPCSEHNDERWTRILVEKPFGSDKENAKRLDKLLGRLFEEDQIFRIDHYLAKEAMQNILTFRFANAIFEPIWNKDFVERVELNLYEKNNVSQRGSLYDGVGALRDVGQNHLIQMLALISMEDPDSNEAGAIRKARGEVLSKVIVPKKDLDDFVRAQYIGYEKEDDVKTDSKTETYFKAKLGIKNSRWKGVPFYIESGKALNENRTEIKIVFKDRDSSFCSNDDTCNYNNTLTIDITKQKITICFCVKKPGLNFDLEQKNLSFEYDEENAGISDAYDKVLFDCIKGDHSLFTSTYESATNWGIISNIFKLWQNIPLLKYKQGSDPSEIKQ